MGINTTYYKVMAFVIGAFFAGVAGGLYAHNFYIIQPSNFGFLKSFDILIFVVLGGLGSLSGSVIAAILLTVISTFLQDYPETRMIIYSLVLIVVMLYRPQGLMGTKEITSVFSRGQNVKGGKKDGKGQTVA
jgi:branched-chain amino acid transport system permease protein